MNNMKKLSTIAKDIYSCLAKGVVVHGNKTDEISELLKMGLIKKIPKGKNKGAYEISKASKN